MDSRQDSIAKFDNTVEIPHRVSSALLGIPKTCAVCGNFNCQLPTHRHGFSYSASIPGKSKKRDFSALMNSSFRCSYTFNPLYIAINYVCDQLNFQFDTNVLGSRGSVASALHKLIAYDVARNVPFEDPSHNPASIGDVAAEWLVATSVDETACVSTLHLWMLIEWNRTQEPLLGIYSTRLASLFLKLLRERVEQRKRVSVGTIFAASNHLNSHLLFHPESDSQSKTMMDGLETLVDSYGGFHALTDATNPGLYQSLLWNDVLYCIYFGARPRYWVPIPPHMPRSLVAEQTTADLIPDLYQRCCSPDVLQTAKCLKLFLAFRPDTKIRKLSKAEYLYLIELERFNIVRVLDQGARHHNMGTVSECIVLALTLFRVSVICIWEQLVWARRKTVQRLEVALRKVNIDSWLTIGAAEALIWVCFVALTQEETYYDQKLFVSRMTEGLKAILGSNVEQWPAAWEERFASEFQPLLWHSDYESKVLNIAKVVHGYAAEAVELRSQFL